MSDVSIELLMQYKKDFLFFAPRVLKIQTMEGKKEKFTLHTPQTILHTIVEAIKAKGRPIRVVALKARRMGFSTYIGGRCYHKTSWNHNRYTMQITHEPQASEFLFKMVKRFYDNTPREFKPETKANNARLLEFNNKEGTGLDSAFRVATAGKEDVGSGQLIHYLHLSEVAKWDSNNAGTLLTAVLQCVPDEPDTEVYFESTAVGIGGEFYLRFWGSRYRMWVSRLHKGEPIIEESINPSADENNEYTSVFLPWFVMPKYRMEPPPDFRCTQEENELKRLYGIDDSQVFWRRRTIANKCNGQLEIFYQEYPSNPKEAFISSGRPVFDNLKLTRLMENAPKPIARYECQTMAVSAQFVFSATGRLMVWKEPVTGGSYIISADVAEGLVKGDFSSADVIDHRTGEQVAQWHGHIHPKEFGKLLVALGRRYQIAIIAVERNNHGLTTVGHLMEANYPRIYAEMVPEPPGKPRRRYGWVTSNTTRPLIIDNLILEVNEGSHGMVCYQTMEELTSFKYQDDGRPEADVGMKDDRVISYAIGKYLRQVLPLPSQRQQELQAVSRCGGTGRKITSSGWT